MCISHGNSMDDFRFTKSFYDFLFVFFSFHAHFSSDSNKPFYAYRFKGWYSIKEE